MQDVSSLKTQLAALKAELARVSVVNEGCKIQINGTFRQVRLEVVSTV